jgi:hypothetical protein
MQGGQVTIGPYGSTMGHYFKLQGSTGWMLESFSNIAVLLSSLGAEALWYKGLHLTLTSDAAEQVLTACQTHDFFNFVSDRLVGPSTPMLWLSIFSAIQQYLDSGLTWEDTLKRIVADMGVISSLDRDVILAGIASGQHLFPIQTMYSRFWIEDSEGLAPINCDWRCWSLPHDYLVELHCIALFLDGPTG